MQRARRLASVVVAASLAVAGLSACRSEHDVAAYIGDTRISADRVTAVYDEVQRSVAAAGPPAQGEMPPATVTRADVLGMLISAQLLPEVAKQHNVTLPATVPVDDYATGIRLKADLEYTRLFAQSNAYTDAILPKMTPASTPPSDADLHEVFDGLIAAAQRGGGPGGTYADFASGLSAQGKQSVQAAAALRTEIGQVADRMKIKVNPRYDAAAIPVLYTINPQNKDYVLLLRAPIAGQDEVAPVSDAR